jgi:Tfp pilus assembly protein PilN
MNLDFCAHSSRPGLRSWLIFALGLVAAGWVLLAWQEAAAARSKAETHLASLQDKPAAQKVVKPKSADVAALNRQRGDAAARSQLNLPWTRLLAALQDSRPPEIAFLNLEADGRRGDFTLAALAKNQVAMLDYFHALQASPGFAQVGLSRHELREVEGAQVVYFSLGGGWTQP